MASDYKFTSYRASSQRAVYDNTMNTDALQASIVERAERVARAVESQGITPTKVDAQPGKHRAHIRVSVPYTTADEVKSKRYDKLAAIRDDESETEEMRKIGRQMTNDAYRYRAYGAWQHNRRIDRVLQAAIDAARG